ncbi:hypothetical protein IV500_01295 [Paeniglutamicibacter antarcticus]|uniref:Uncharacterized protein n=1 Tax=Arthrobacter terrae TaxID=2935737 RepID=A0A931G469_9MICC|nr:hypothetical protein [Arthrobacter terrae]MBG0738070.1 hypothetical protein [Arthrobacter terrae]
MDPYYAQQLAQAHFNDLLRYRQTHVPSGQRQTIPIRRRLHLLFPRWTGRTYARRIFHLADLLKRFGQ